MRNISKIRSIMLVGCACSGLAACGADDVASPGEGTIVIPSPTPSPSPSPSPSPTPTPGSGEAADACPSDTYTDGGTISGPSGSYRVCEFPQRFIENTQVAKVPGVIYSLPGRVDVGADVGADGTKSGGNPVTLTIDPGVVVFGATGVSYLAVNRGSKIDAVGTASDPIIFTGRGNVTGTVDDNSSQLWGGVVLLGRAPVTDCAAPGAEEGTAACERDTEGTSNALFGGALPNDSSGRMSYVQIRYSGFVLSADKELQGLTPSGVGTGTQLDHIQVHNSSDDGIEMFGGRPRLKYIVLTGNEDDNLDSDTGVKAYIQYVIAVQRAGGAVGDAMLEIDSDGNENAVPRQNVSLSNFTFVHRATATSDAAAILIRGGADYHMMNGVLTSNEPCVRINSATTIQDADADADEAGPPQFDSVVMQCGGDSAFLGTNGVTDAQVEAIFNDGSNNDADYTSTLTDLFINGANETAVTPFDASTIDGFFDATDYIGAVADANDTWYAGWTCNSATADFGSESSACTTLPTT